MYNFFIYAKVFGLLLAFFFLLGLLPTSRKSAEGGMTTATAQMFNFRPLFHAPRIHFS